MARRYSKSRAGHRNSIRTGLYFIAAILVIGLLVYIIFGRDSDPGVDPNSVAVEPSGNDMNLPGQEGTAQEPKIETHPPTTPDVQPNTEAQEFMAEAMAVLAADPTNIIQARNRLNETLKLPMSRRQRLFVKDQLSSMAEKWLFTRDLYAQDTLCTTYKVQPGDLLSTIAKQHKVPFEILMAINFLSRPENLPSGQNIKVINGPFHAKIYRSTFTLDLYLQDMYIRSFKVGLGKPGRETPTGLWQAAEGGKLIQPTWTDPDTGIRYEANDPNYPLGARWIGLEGLEGQAKDRTGFAIHGTKDPQEIGKAVSRGCIRMYNDDVMLMYNLLTPVHSKIQIED